MSKIPLSHVTRQSSLSKRAKSSELRIIAGKFRSRKITFTEEKGLRPTHNRIRETLFNWLGDTIENTVCFDVFAGSGALGFEALSRGAKKVTFMDISKNVIETLKDNAAKLAATNVDFINGNFILENTTKNTKFDIVFCDPPFKQNILIVACELLEARNLLNSRAFIYLEFEKNSVNISLLPKHWKIKKHKSTQTIEYLLCQKDSESVDEN